MQHTADDAEREGDHIAYDRKDAPDKANMRLFSLDGPLCAFTMLNLYCFSAVARLRSGCCRLGGFGLCPAVARHGDH